MVWFFLKIWHEECQDNSADPTIPNASSDSGLTDINVLKDTPEIFFVSQNKFLNDEEKFNTYCYNKQSALGIKFTHARLNSCKIYIHIAQLCSHKTQICRALR